MRLSVIGGTGYTGSHIVSEAAMRSLEVTSFSRHLPRYPVKDATYQQADVLNSASLELAFEGADVVLVALSPRGAMLGQVRPAVIAIADMAAQHGVRLGVMGGAGSLKTSEDGPSLLESHQVPEAAVPESSEMAQVLYDLKSRDDVDWFMICPALVYGENNPGIRTGQYRIDDDLLVTDGQGNSKISGADLAVAFLDEVTHPSHHRQRFSVGY